MIAERSTSLIRPPPLQHHRRLRLGPDQLAQQLQTFLDGVIWLSLENLGQQADLDPWLTLLTLPVQPEAELKRSTQEILDQRPDLLSTVLTILFERLPTLTPEELMVFAGIPTDQLLHTRAAQDLVDRGRQEGRQEGEAQGEATTARIQALLDFSGPADLAAWLAEYAG